MLCTRKHFIHKSQKTRFYKNTQKTGKIEKINRIFQIKNYVPEVTATRTMTRAIVIFILDAFMWIIEKRLILLSKKWQSSKSNQTKWIWWRWRGEEWEHWNLVNTYLDFCVRWSVFGRDWILLVIQLRHLWEAGYFTCSF